MYSIPGSSQSVFYRVVNLKWRGVYCYMDGRLFISFGFKYLVLDGECFGVCESGFVFVLTLWNLFKEQINVCRSKNVYQCN